MTAEERRARRAEWPVRVVSSGEASVTADAMAEADLELYRAMTGTERLRVLTALVNPDGVRAIPQVQLGRSESSREAPGV